MTTLSYSQNTYPKQIVLNNDSVVVITKLQLKKANKIFANEAYLSDRIKLIEQELDYTIVELKIQENKAKELNSKIEELLESKREKEKEIDSLNEKLIKQKAKSQRRGLGLLGTVGIIILLVI